MTILLCEENFALVNSVTFPHSSLLLLCEVEWVGAILSILNGVFKYLVTRTIGLFQFSLFVARIDLRPELVSHCCNFVCHCGNCIFYTPPVCTLAPSRPLTCTNLTFWPSRIGCPKGETNFQGGSKHFRKLVPGVTNFRGVQNKHDRLILKTNCIFKYKPPFHFRLDVVYKMGGIFNGTLRYFLKHHT